MDVDKEKLGSSCFWDGGYMYSSHATPADSIQLQG